MLIATVLLQTYAAAYLDAVACTSPAQDIQSFASSRANLRVAIPSTSAPGNTALFMAYSLHEAEKPYDQVTSLDQDQIR